MGCVLMLHCRTEEKVEEMCAFECPFKYIYIRRKNVKKTVEENRCTPSPRNKPKEMPSP